MSRTDAQNGLDMVFKFLVCYFRLYSFIHIVSSLIVYILRLVI